MNGVVTFDGALPPGMINLAIGQPSADTLPANLSLTRRNHWSSITASLKATNAFLVH